MFFCTLAALKNSLIKKEKQKEKNIVEVLKHASDRRKKAGT